MPSRLRYRRHATGGTEQGRSLAARGRASRPDTNLGDAAVLEPLRQLLHARRDRREHRHLSSPARPRRRTHPMLLAPDVDPRHVPSKHREAFVDALAAFGSAPLVFIRHTFTTSRQVLVNTGRPGGLIRRLSPRGVPHGASPMFNRRPGAMLFLGHHAAPMNERALAAAVFCRRLNHLKRSPMIKTLTADRCQLGASAGEPRMFDVPESQVSFNPAIRWRRSSSPAG